MSYLAAIETAVPQFCHNQEDVSKFYQRATDDEIIKRKIHPPELRMLSHKATVFLKFLNN